LVGKDPNSTLLATASATISMVVTVTSFSAERSVTEILHQAGTALNGAKKNVRNREKAFPAAT